MEILWRSFSIKSWDSWVSIVTGHGLDSRGLSPGRENIFLFSTAALSWGVMLNTHIHLLMRSVVELYLHSPICLHDMVCNYLSMDEFCTITLKYSGVYFHRHSMFLIGSICSLISHLLVYNSGRWLLLLVMFFSTYCGDDPKCDFPNSCKVLCVCVCVCAHGWARVRAPCDTYTAYKSVSSLFLLHAIVHTEMQVRVTM
jgi:hypothetical protein